MSERQPNRNMRLTIDGEEKIATPENTALYLHDNRMFAMLDHIFVMSRDDQHNQYGHYVFREQMTNFEEISQHMQNNGYTVHELDDIADCDRTAYETRFGAPELELPTQDLTPRQERFCTYFKHLLESNHLGPESFGIEGNLEI